jgi:NAD+ kinase
MKVALRGGDGDVVDAVTDAGAEVVGADDADLLVAVGEAAVLSLAEDPVSLPVLPVYPGGELHAVSRSRLPAALSSVTDDDYRLVTHPVLGLTVGGERVARAVTDTMLVTSEPARISEYAVRTPDERVEQFRADAVVVATPLGSTGYASTVGGSAVASDAGLSVVPVAPFSTGVRTWVIRPPLTLTVERDEGDVTLLADDREVQHIDPHVPVHLRRADTFELVRVPETGE